MTINGTLIEENTFLKTLGINFDSLVTFKKQWGEVTKSGWNKLYAISHLREHIDMGQRKQLGQGLIVSKLSYCIEATSSCPKTMLAAPTKLLNRTVRTITGEWNREETQCCYSALDWLTLKEFAVLGHLLWQGK